MYSRRMAPGNSTALPSIMNLRVRIRHASLLTNGIAPHLLSVTFLIVHGQLSVEFPEKWARGRPQTNTKKHNVPFFLHPYEDSVGHQAG